MGKTILDYGATLYKTKTEAETGWSSSSAIQDMINDVYIAVLPDYGFIKHNKEVFLYREGESVIGNGGCALVNNHDTNMFRPINHRHKIKGFTAYLDNGGSVVYVGGAHDGIAYARGGHQWPNRTQILANVWDFDCISNYTGTPIRLEYSKEVTGTYGDNSHFHNTKIRGYWENVDNGIIINKKDNSGQSINTFDIDVSIRGFNKIADIRGFNAKINFGKIRIMAQLLKDTGELFYVQGSQLNGDIFCYTESHNFEKGNYHVKDLDLSGYFDLLPYTPKQIANLNDSKLI